MSTPHFTERPGDMDILDFWTQRSLDAYWKELVKETQEVNLTGWTETRDEYDSDTGPSDWLYLRILKKPAPLGAKNWISPKSPKSPKSAKSADLHPKSEKFDYTCNTGIKKNTFLVVIPVTLLSPQVRSKKTPLGFEKRGLKKSPLPNLETFL